MRLNAEQEKEFVLPKERLLLYTDVPLLYNKMTKEKSDSTAYSCGAVFNR